MSNVESGCVACGNARSVLVLQKMLEKPFPRNVTLKRCEECQTVFLADWQKGFVDELYDYYASRIGLERRDLYNALNDLRYSQLLGEISPLLSGKKILDVGCGEGQFVDFALRRSWDVLGIELSDSAVALCEKFGLPVKKADVFDRSLHQASFDMIMLSEVIEHVPNLIDFVKRLEQLLAKGGVLYLTTPNFNSLDRRVLGADWRVIHPEHITYFTPRTLSRLVARASKLEQIFLRTRNISLPTLRRLIFPISFSRHSTEKRIGEESLSMNDESRLDEQRLRVSIEQSSAMLRLKEIMNYSLDRLSLGSTIVALYRKP